MSGTDEQENLNSQAGSDNIADQIADLKAEIADLRKEAASYRSLTCIRC